MVRCAWGWWKGPKHTIEIVLSSLLSLPRSGVLSTREGKRLAQGHTSGLDYVVMKYQGSDLVEINFGALMGDECFP